MDWCENTVTSVSGLVAVPLAVFPSCSLSARLCRGRWDVGCVSRHPEGETLKGFLSSHSFLRAEEWVRLSPGKLALAAPCCYLEKKEVAVL